MKELSRKVWRSSMTALLLGFFLFTQGCSLLWLGAAGTGGYLIRMGEEGGGAKKQASGSERRSSTNEY